MCEIYVVSNLTLTFTATQGTPLNTLLVDSSWRGWGLAPTTSPLPADLDTASLLLDLLEVEVTLLGGLVLLGDALERLLERILG